VARRLKRYTLYATLAVLVIAVGFAAIFLLRLSQGPVALTFLTDRVQNMMNANVSGVRASIGDVILERDQDTGVPRFRLRDIRLQDPAGNLIAMAPRAAIDVSGRALLAGRVEPIEFELIGAEIVVRRQRDGSFQLGFGAAGDSAPSLAGSLHGQAGQGSDGKQDRADMKVPDDAPEYQTAEVLQFLDQELLSEDESASVISSLVSFKVSQASISLYDEANEAWWHAPQANLVLRRVAYGFALFADANIASGAAPWRSEIVASYKAQARTFSVSARVFDLIPADIAEDVFALSQFAQVRLPLSGQANVEFTRDGKMMAASAELKAAAGRVGFPDYISEPVLIDEGLVRLDYEPHTGHLVLGESVVYIGGRPTWLTGRIEPVRGDPDSDKLTAINFAFEGGSPAADVGAQDAAAAPALDRIEIRGVASVQEARLDLDDLLLMSGDSGLRMRGRFIGGDGVVGVYLDGIARDLPANLIKKLWPPIVAGGARSWMRDNVTAGRISDANFRIAIPSATLAAALDGQALPDDMVEFTFALADVDMRYLGELPPVRGASGVGRLSGDTFRLELENGVATLPSGEEVRFRRGTMTTTEVAARLSPTVLQIEAEGQAQAVLELIDLEPLRLVTKAGFDRSKFGGAASASVTIEMPLAKTIPDGSVRVAAQARLENAQFRDALEGMSIEDGNLAITVDESSFRVAGPVRLNGTEATLEWTRLLGAQAGGDDDIVLEAELDEADRERFGARIGAFVRGPVRVRVSAKEEDGRLAHAHVKADLSKADLRLDAIGWTRPAGGEVSAAFDLDLTEDHSIAVRNLTMTGERLELAGRLKLGRDGRLLDANFATVRLDGSTDVAVSLKPDGDGFAASVTGRSFDARPLIGQLFSTAASPPDEGALSMRIDADIETMLAHRGEAITELRGTLQLTGGVVDAADLSGSFLSGRPMSLRVVPAGSDMRELRLNGGDGGAALRAADLYSKVIGGSIDFRAWLGPGRTGRVQRGLLVIDRFDVENEVVLDEVEWPSGRGASPAPRRDGYSFSQLRLPFSVDESYIRIGDALVKGPEIGASAQGHIRKADGIMDIGGTIIPAYAINAALTDVPLLGDLLTGGKGEGMFGLTYALKGPRHNPQFLFNPVSAIAPGIFRRLFDIGGGGVAADGTKAKPPRMAPAAKISR
jgi:hypothetical protein